MNLKRVIKKEKFESKSLSVIFNKIYTHIHFFIIDIWEYICFVLPALCLLLFLLLTSVSYRFWQSGILLVLLLFFLFSLFISKIFSFFFLFLSWAPPYLASAFESYLSWFCKSSVLKASGIANLSKAVC